MKKSKKQYEYDRLTHGLDNSKYWHQVLTELERPFADAERRDRYHKTIHGDKDLSTGSNITLFDLLMLLGQGLDDLLIRRETAHQLFDLMDQLSEKDLFILVDIFQNSKTLSVVGMELGISISDVIKRKIKGLNILAKLLKNQDFWASKDAIGALFDHYNADSSKSLSTYQR
ncbi:hypothetical protein [Lactiplantibacillus plantarum]|uniref:hypothetical protein n=1 Tax=Lactiplantibacillus plantarum TaxID=1590 RepID=UPI001F4C51AB|nr:hypothetical protein [Lactiplantibacillus plantarum]UNB86156.1 hypothetical protein LXM95_07415 [Lactiplantibacillus plantarum]